jgi:hypothetical protein
MLPSYCKQTILCESFEAHCKSKCYRMLHILHIVEYILYTIVSIKPPSCALRYGFTCIAGLLF